MFPSLIETERLSLRRPTLADAEAIYTGFASDPRVTRYLSWPAHRSVTDAERFLREQAERAEAGQEFSWAVFERGDDKLCGMIGVRLDPPRATLGYCLAHQAWGYGFATEATLAIVPVVWSRRDIERLEAYCHTKHLRSARVLEKAGLRYVGVAREHRLLPALGRHAQDMLRYRKCRPLGRQTARRFSECSREI